MGTSTENCSFNFWDLKEYQKTVKRLENGHKLCSELATMLHERAEIEKAYSISLNRWSGKWNQFFETGSEYGTLKKGCQSFCTEADRVATIHKDIRDKLETDVVNEVKRWQKENFHKQALPPQHLKEVKQLEQSFEIAQKPWAKRYRNVQNCRKEYHAACKTVQSCKIQLNNAKADTTLTSEQQRKIEEKLAKAEKENARTKAEYETAVKLLDDDNSRYMEDMTKVFDSSQEKERDRIRFFKNMLMKAHEILNVSQNVVISQIYAQLEETVISIQDQEDLSWWAVNYGSDMKLFCLQFEEFNPEQSSMTAKRKTKVLRDGEGVVLTRVQPNASGPEGSTTTIRQEEDITPASYASSIIRTDTVTHAAPPNGVKPISSHTKIAKNGKEIQYDETLNPFASVDMSQETGNPFEDEDDGEGVGGNERVSVVQDGMFDDGRPGLRVRALYDYDKSEADELSLKAGDIFEKLEEQDEQGWCKGRKNGCVGLYPADYAVPCE